MTRSIKSLADAIGLPDKEDKARIERYLLKYEREHPGEIMFHRNAAREHLKDVKFGLLDAVSSKAAYSSGTNRRYLFELPTEIGNWMGQAYPLMFKDKKHLAWFCKNFKELMIPEQY